MILKIYIATVVITVLAAVLVDIKQKRIFKIYRYKRYKRTFIELLSSLLLCLIVFALPIINIILAIYLLALDDDKLLETARYSDNYYMESDNEC